jgi:hypothetical protein
MLRSFLVLVSLAILPAGTVKDERVFFILLSFLVILLVIALLLRHKRQKNGT